MKNALWGTETLCRKVSKLPCDEQLNGWEPSTTTHLHNLDDGFPEDAEYYEWQEKFIKDHCKKCPECCIHEQIIDEDCVPPTGDPILGMDRLGSPECIQKLLEGEGEDGC
jgi:hypothetical protein